MNLEDAIRAVAAEPTNMKARAGLAGALEAAGAPEAENVWKATVRCACGRGQFFVALALARRYLSPEALEDALAEMARRFGAGRPRQGPIVALPSPTPSTVEVPEDPDDQIFTALRVGTDIESLVLPKFARMPSIPLFEDLPESEFVALAREVEPVALFQGDDLMIQDATDRAVYVLVRGRAKAMTRKPDGAHVDLGEVAGPTVLGEMALLTAVPRRSSVTSLGNGLAWKIDAERLVGLAAEQPGLIDRMRNLVKARLLHDLLKSSAVLSQIENQGLVLAAFAVRSFAEGSEVFAQGAPPPGLFFLLHGTGEVWTADDSGTPRKVAVLTEGDAFGEMSLLTGDPTTAAVRMPHGGITLHLSPEAYSGLRSGAADLEAGLADLMDVRRGKLELFRRERALYDEAGVAADEVVMEIDESWVMEVE
jgi:CRP-like cAMP-binding protein